MTGSPLPPERVAAIFDRIAPLYDIANTLMTAGTDARWRAAAVHAARLQPGQRVLDVACGTGALTRLLARRVEPGGEAIGLDASPGMLARAHGATFLQGDALALPFADGAFDAVTIGFGLRNLADYLAGLREMVRVVRPGGRLVVLEIAAPQGGLPRMVYLTWFQRVIPNFGRLLGRGGAYRYLPDSLGRYPTPDKVAELMETAGLDEVRWRWLQSGLATLHAGVRPTG